MRIEVQNAFPSRIIRHGDGLAEIAIQLRMGALEVGSRRPVLTLSQTFAPLRTSRSTWLTHLELEDALGSVVPILEQGEESLYSGRDGGITLAVHHIYMIVSFPSLSVAFRKLLPRHPAGA